MNLNVRLCLFVLFPLLNVTLKKYPVTVSITVCIYVICSLFKFTRLHHTLLLNTSFGKSNNTWKNVSITLLHLSLFTD